MRNLIKGMMVIIIEDFLTIAEWCVFLLAVPCAAVLWLLGNE